MAPHVALNILERYKNRKVDLLGVVVEFSIPRATKGTDYMMSLKIVDESLQEVNVNMFLAAVSDFPVIQDPGDVIYLNNVKVDIFDGKASAVFKKTVSYFSLYSGSTLGDFKAYAPCQSYVLTDALNKKIDGLRLWHRNTQLNAGSSDYLISSMKDLAESQSFDLICKVLCIVAEYDDEVGPCLCYLLYVWDGTDVPLQRINGKFDAEELSINTDLDLLPRNILRYFPQAGTILKVMVEVGVGDFHNYFHFDDMWVRLRNIKCECVHGMWKALSDNLKLRLLPESDQTVQERDRSYEQRLRKNGCLPMLYDPLSDHLTEIRIPSSINYEDSEFVSLLHVVAYPKVKVLFKCVVRLVAFYTSGGLSSMRFTLEDPTMRLHAFMVPSDGVYLFHGCSTHSELSNKLKNLLGIPEHDNFSSASVSRSPPWIQCAISASLIDPRRPDGSRKYLIRYTRMT